MTLILTELSEYGIAMAADTAVTMLSRSTVTRSFERVYFGVRKLRPIFKIQAGVSVWGQGEINGVDTDVWLGEFITRREDDYNSLQEFAILL